MMDADLSRRATNERQRQSQLAMRIGCCQSSGCLALGAEQTLGRLRAATEHAPQAIEVVPVGCVGLCGRGPVVRASSPAQASRVFLHVAAEHVDAALPVLMDSSAPVQSPVEVLLEDHAFFRAQQRLVLANAGHINPECLDEALAAGGYAQFGKILNDSTPEQVCVEITRSGLRGRGGAGYPAGVKWDLVRKAAAAPKYVVANGDEGDPGAFMDRAIMESDPHRLLEGMMIAAYAVGAQYGYLYVRGEYPLAVARLRRAIRDARQAGLLGHQILGSRFSLDLEVRIGAGAYVCGEETALLASIEGGRGMPRPRPPYPSEEGLFGCPTLINNVETLAAIPAILQLGAEKYASIGTATSKGTKVFALSGTIRRSGVIEVPMGTTLRCVVEEIGGGVLEGHILKAVQTGGPAGGCIPAAQLDLPIDYEAMQAAGSIIGSGGMIVIDERTSMVELARFFMGFCRDESCGKCIPCRAGTVQLHGLLERIERGSAGLEDLELLEDLCDVVKNTSLCGLGQAAPNPILSTLRYFREEYEAKVPAHRKVAGTRVSLPLTN